MERSVWGGLIGLAGLFLLLASSPTSDARMWDPAPNALAADYVIIQDLGNDRTVLIFWVVPELGETQQEQESLRQLLDGYTLIGAVNVRTIGVQFEKVESDSPLLIVDNQAHEALAHSQEPDGASGLKLMMGAVLSGMFGTFGEQIDWHLYELDLQACAHNDFSVNFANELYTYETPIPGCPQA